MDTCQNSRFCQLAGGGRDANQQTGLLGGHTRDGLFVCGSSAATLGPPAVPAVGGICVRGGRGAGGSRFPMK